MKANTLFLALYRHWPNAVTTVGVFSTEPLARDAITQSGAPLETSGEVLTLRLDEAVEVELSDGL